METNIEAQQEEPVRPPQKTSVRRLGYGCCSGATRPEIQNVCSLQFPATRYLESPLYVL